MLNTVYRLTAPRRFEAHFTDIDINGEEVLVRPTHLSICNADQRYYQGRRAGAGASVHERLVCAGIGNEET